MATIKTFDDLFLNELRDIYSAEKQLIKALPKMAKAANSDKLRAGFEEHLAQTQIHAERLESILNELGKTTRGEKCAAMEGLIEEGKKAIEEIEDPMVLDAALIGAAQRVEHYEMAAYGTAATFAKLLGNKSAEKLLRQTLSEEKATDEKLTKLAESEINPAAQMTNAS